MHRELEVRWDLATVGVVGGHTVGQAPGDMSYTHQLISFSEQPLGGGATGTQTAQPEQPSS